MRIVVTGGGTAGHVTPTLAVATELKRLDPSAEITYYRQFGDKYAKSALGAADEPMVDRTRVIFAGKFRRFHGVAWWRQVLAIPMQLRNIRDLGLFVLGFIQSLIYLLLHRPKVVFAKGGYVGLPVGLAAWTLRIPLVIHESDTKMGLTNRILSQKATYIGVGAPIEYYDAASNKLRFVGVPISNKFTSRVEQKSELKEKLGFNGGTPLVLIVGGSNGAQILNAALTEICVPLAKLAGVAHVTGQETYIETNEDISNKTTEQATAYPYQVIPYIEGNMHEYVGAADVVITRVGATAMAELAAMKKAAILVPNPKLVQGHQLVNAKIYQKAEAAIILYEEDIIESPDALLDSVKQLIDDDKLRAKIEKNLYNLSRPDSAGLIAKMIKEAT